jgi:hypothetical protein
VATAAEARLNIRTQGGSLRRFLPKSNKQILDCAVSALKRVQGTM